MSHSNSSLNCFSNCMRKYEHSYILHTTPCTPPSPHLTFGTMAHNVLYMAGVLRDDAADKVITPGEYYSIMPSEILYQDLKTFFNISNWNNYFKPIIKQVYEYEQECVANIRELCPTEDITIKREQKLYVNSETLIKAGYCNIEDGITGIIDLLIMTNTHAIIIDYKFSDKVKTQDDFDLNSQLQLYAFLVNKNYGIPIKNIQYGYIDIPKKAFSEPVLLSNGYLSRSKSQNISQEMYKAAVEAIHGDDPTYNCNPGGFYYDCYCNLIYNKAAYMSLQYLDISTYKGIIKDLMHTAVSIEYFKSHNLNFLAKYDSYTCKGCEYLKACKPWLNVCFEKEEIK